MKIIIPLIPRSKKNSMQIVYAGKRPLIIPSAKYKQYEKDCAVFMPKIDTIDYPVNVKALYYMPTHRKIDKTNLESALLDVLVKYKVLQDDNSNIVVSTDGSRVLFDKENPRTEIYIERIKNE